MTLTFLKGGPHQQWPFKMKPVATFQEWRGGAAAPSLLRELAKPRKKNHTYLPEAGPDRAEREGIITSHSEPNHRAI